VQHVCPSLFLFVLLFIKGDRLILDMVARGIHRSSIEHCPTARPVADRDNELV
jgi:hypothetical protein